MNIMFICGDCNGQSDGILRKRTKYDNTTNMDELDVCCLFCGKVLARTFSSRCYTDLEQDKLWEENKKRSKHCARNNKSK